MRKNNVRGRRLKEHIASHRIESNDNNLIGAFI